MRARAFKNLKQSTGLSGLKLGNKSRKQLYKIFDKIAEHHPVDEVSEFFQGLEKLGAKKCARLPWKYWRYTWGAYPEKKLSRDRWKKYSVKYDGHGAALLQEQFPSKERALARSTKRFGFH